MSEPWLSADDIAEHLGVTKDTIYAWISDKGMPAHKVGRLWKFQASEVDDWVRRGDAAMSAARRILIDLPFSRGGTTWTHLR